MPGLLRRAVFFNLLSTVQFARNHSLVHENGSSFVLNVEVLVIVAEGPELAKGLKTTVARIEKSLHFLMALRRGFHAKLWKKKRSLENLKKMQKKKVFF